MSRYSFLKYSLSAVGASSVVLASGYTRVHAKEKRIDLAPVIEGEDHALIQPWTAPSRDAVLKRLKSEKYDVLIIGGGATGTGCALDAASRNLKAALVERDDFASGTSGRSTKLIHGGIRYLETAFLKLDYGAFKLVQEALEERAYMLNAAPYMNKAVPIMIPVYTWWELPYMWVGAKFYDLVAGKARTVPASHFMTPSEALYQFPMLRKDKLKGAIVYFDGQMNDTRMGVSIALTAAQAGSAVANRVEVVHLLKNESGKVSGAHVRDTMSGNEWDIHATTVINATGPFSDGIRKMDDPSAHDLIVPAAGVHVILPDHYCPDNMGLIVPKTKDGRVLFFLPWHGSTLAGTTDSESEITMLPRPTKQEVDFIIEEANRYLDRPVNRDTVKSAWSGLRPLAKDPRHLGEATSKLPRDHVLEVSKSGLITIAGGKWTTFRRMAQDTIDLAVNNEELKVKAGPSNSINMKLIGADRLGEVCKQKFDWITVTLREKYKLDKDVAVHLTRNYGTRALQIAEINQQGFLNRKGGESPHRLIQKYPFLEEEVVFAVRHEYALKAVDVLARRTRLAFIDAAASENVSKRVVEIMAGLLGWDKKQKDKELLEIAQYLDTMHGHL